MISQVTSAWDSRCCLLKLVHVEKYRFVLLFLFQSACIVDCNMSLKGMTCEVSFAGKTLALEAIPVVVFGFRVVPDVKGQ